MRRRFPPEGGPLDDTWFAPLLKVQRALDTPSRLPSDRFFDPHDFMVMERLVRSSPARDMKGDSEAIAP